jgi:ribosomal protein S8
MWLQNGCNRMHYRVGTVESKMLVKVAGIAKRKGYLELEAAA